jgi:Tfp pilus assembly protein PilF
MDPRAQPQAPLELVPIDEQPAGDGASDSIPAGLVARATAEFDAGRVNQTLWLRALGEAKGDKNAAKSAYARSRAAQLQRGQDVQRTDNAVIGGSAPPSAEKVHPRTAPRAPVVPIQRSEAARKPASTQSAATAATPRRNYIAAGAALLGFVVVLAGVLATRQDDDAPAPGAVDAIRSTPARAQKAPAPPPASASTPADPIAEIAAKVRELREAGNWNVHVLYANEWTRKDPSNVAAWSELAVGYANLRQPREGADAATKALELAPQDATLWRRLGELKAASYDTEAALHAFERAAALDPNDVYSRVRTGVLNAELNRLPQAKAVFDGILAANPGDVDALCGRMDVAKKLASAKEADALAKQVASLGARCPEPADAESSAVPVPAAAPSKGLPAKAASAGKGARTR